MTTYRRKSGETEWEKMPPVVWLATPYSSLPNLETLVEIDVGALCMTIIETIELPDE